MSSIHEKKQALLIDEETEERIKIAAHRMRLKAPDCIRLLLRIGLTDVETINYDIASLVVKAALSKHGSRFPRVRRAFKGLEKSVKPPSEGQ